MASGEMTGVNRSAPFGDVTTIQSRVADVERSQFSQTIRLVDDLDQRDDHRRCASNEATSSDIAAA